MKNVGFKISIDDIRALDHLNEFKWIKFSVLIGFFSKLLKAADKFLQKFNIRRLKFGTIIEFLDKLGMVKSKEAMARVMITIKVWKLVSEIHSSSCT